MVVSNTEVRTIGMAAPVKLTINGKQATVASGSTVLEAAETAGVYIPTLCYFPGLPPYGACRLCLVEIEGMRRLTTACTTPVTEGMIVRTDTPQIQLLADPKC